MTEMHQESQNWVRTIEEEKGYKGIDAASYRTLLRRMPGYAFFDAVLRYVQPGQSVLEAGCGWALASFALAERGVKTTAIDISEKLVADLQILERDLGEPLTSNLSVLAYDIFRLPELQRTFDAVISDGTYEHFLRDEDRRRFLAIVRGILHSGGYFIIAVPNLQNPLFSSVVDQKMPSMHVFSMQDLAEELERGGFQAIEQGYSFVNPGFAQWTQARWMIPCIRMADVIFRFLPRSFRRIVGAHLYCVARRTP